MELIDRLEALEKRVEELKEASLPAKTYIRVVDLDERGSYRAHVEDEDGNVVFSYSNEEDELDDEGNPTGNKIEGELWLTADGFMEHVDDLAGLERYLKSHKMISRDSELVDQGQNESINEENDFSIDDVIRGIKGSYGDKYNDRDYEDFRQAAAKVKSKKQLISLVSNLFDLDYADARDMVESETFQGEHAPLVTEQDDEETTQNYENHLSNENIERFVDGLLTVLGELELEGQIPAINTPQQARDALLAVVRRLYIKKSAVAKMSRKFARFGAKRFLRKQKTAIGKAVSEE